mgnify:FL=1
MQPTVVVFDTSWSRARIRQVAERRRLGSPFFVVVSDDSATGGTADGCLGVVLQPLERYDIEDLNLEGIDRPLNVGAGFLDGFRIAGVQLPSSCFDIGENFLRNTSLLNAVDFSGLTRLRCIPDGFCAQCGVSDIDLRPLANVVVIGRRFFSAASNLRSIDATPLSNLTQIPDYFLTSCESLDKVVLPTACISHIGRSFLANCTSLVEVDPSPMVKCGGVRSIGESFMHNCQSLAKLQIDNIPLLLQVPNDFLSDCHSLTVVKLECPSATVIGDRFLAGCRGLRQFDFSGLANITSVGYSCLLGCSELTELDLTPWTSSSLRISDFFLHRCTKLRCVRLLAATQVASVIRFALSSHVAITWM